MSGAPSLSITVTVDASPAVLAAAADLAAALRAVAGAISSPPEPPALAPAGPLLVVPHGAEIGFSTMSELPLGKRGVQALNATAGEYDGPIRWSAAEGDGAAGTVTAADPDGLAGQVEWHDEAVEGEVVTMVAEADRRHGEGALPSRVEFPVTAVAKDAEPLTGGGFRVVDIDQPAPAA